MARAGLFEPALAEAELCLFIPKPYPNRSLIIILKYIYTNQYPILSFTDGAA